MLNRNTISFHSDSVTGLQYFQQRYMPKIKELMMQEIPSDFRIKLPENSTSHPSTSREKLYPDNSKGLQPVTAGSNQQLLLEDFKPNPRWVFESYVCDDTNRMAYHAAQKISARKSDELLFIHADVGQGKSHLLHACAAAWQANHPQLNSRLLSAATFTHNFIQALQNQQNGIRFHSEIRSLDALFFDDLHFIADKKATCLALFQGIEALRNNGKTVIITSRESLSDLDNLQPWMASHLRAGAIRIQEAGQKLREELVRKITSKRRIDLTDDITRMLVTELPGSPRELSGAITRIAEYIDLHKTENLATDRARLLLTDFFSGRSRVPHVDAIKEKVASYYAINVSDLLSASRRRSVTQPRQIAMYFCKQLTPRSLPEIGRLFGNRDHSTVIHAVQVVSERCNKNSSFAEEILSLERQIRECPTL